MKLAPVYLVFSEHVVLVDRMVRELRDAAVGPDLRAFNEEIVDGRPTAERILASARQLPMMGPCRLVWVKDIATLSAEDGAQIAEYIKSPCPTTVLVLVTSKLDKRLKLPAAAAKAGYLHTLTAPRQIQPWLAAEAKRIGVAFDAKAIVRLAELIGDDLSRGAAAIEQLGVYAGGAPVSAHDVDELIAPTRERSVFELTDALGDGDAKRALAAVAALTNQRESALGVVAMLARYVRQLGTVWELGGNGDLAAQLGVPPFAVDRLKAQARRIPPATLRQATLRLAEVDRLLKGDPTRAGARISKGLGRPLAERVLLESCVLALLPTR